MEEMQRPPIRAMFNAIADRYDLINRMVSFRRDVAWRRALAAAIPTVPGMRVLDLASGTGDVLLAVMRALPQDALGVGADLSEAMLAHAAEKIRAAGEANRCALAVSDAATLPFPDGQFDLVTIAFGVRNFVRLPESLAEIRRVLKPGGQARILEFSLPANMALRAIYLLYFRWFLPRIAGWISRQPAAYRYLNQSVEAFPYGDAFAGLLRQAGFQAPTHRPLTFGIATLYIGHKQA